MEEADLQDELKETMAEVDKEEEEKENRPPSSSFLQISSQVEVEAQAAVQAQIKATMQARSQATVQAKAAAEALAALGVDQQSQIKVQDQDLINNLKRTISALEAKKNPHLAAAQAKKKAVNNI